MPETRPPPRTTKNEDTPHVEHAEEAERRRRERRARERVRDPRAHDVGLDSRDTERNSEGVGFAEERTSPDTEHKTGRMDDGAAT